MNFPFKLPESKEEWQAAFTGMVFGSIATVVGLPIGILLR